MCLIISANDRFYTSSPYLPRRSRIVSARAREARSLISRPAAQLKQYARARESAPYERL